MTNQHFYYSLFAGLDKNTTILTPNRRLSAVLLQLYQDYQQQQGCQVWSTPDILPATTWVQRLWLEDTCNHLISAPLLLNSAQEDFLWENILNKDKESIALLQLTETAEIAKSAWTTLKQWKTGLNHPVFQQTSDYQTFLAWANQWQALCEEQHWLDNASLIDHVIKNIHRQTTTPTNRLLLVGFTELSPQLKELVSYFTSELITPPSIAESKRISLADTDEELLSMARFAKTIHHQHPNARIGCVVPHLEKIRDRVIQVFNTVWSNHPSTFNLSAGTPLRQCAIIQTALQLLALQNQTIYLEKFSSLLASPFLGHAESERIKRANYDSQLRKENVTAVRLTTDSLDHACPNLAKRLRQFFTLLDATPKTLSYRAWATVFVELLTLMGWPGERSLNSEEYQTVEHWLKLLENFAAFDQIASPTTFAHALHALQKMAANSIFQPKTPDAPIQILGLLEAAGLPFDYLWVAGMDDMSWPAQPKPNPLIPKRLQRELNMPHATAERELLYCQALTQQFKQNAVHLIFSHAEKVDELERQASPLIRELPLITLDALKLDPYQPAANTIYQSRKMSMITDFLAPPPQANDKVLGGVNILKQQALCPFKAFAELRLHAHQLESPLPGMRAKERGNLLHKVMELLWNQLHDHDTLMQCSDNNLKQIIQDSIDQALLAFATAENYRPHYLNLEKKRLKKLVWDWLAVEKQRTAFVVQNCEKSAQITLNKLSLKIRIDRIDLLPDGNKLIIDYKTGKNNTINSWLDTRPDEPQLPLYALLDPINTIGVAVAQIAPGHHCFKGISRYDLEINGIKASPTAWPDQLQSWQAILTQLGNDFYEGIAHVAPKDPIATCEWCTLKPLCRIKEEAIAHHEH